MNKINYIICIVLISLFVGCDCDEDTAPSCADQAVFEPSVDDMSETARIRRDFYDNTGCYLLFSDTLRTVASGVGLDGKPIVITELLDVMGYAMIGYGSTTKYIYDYITEPEQQLDAVKLIQDNLLWRMGKALPFSFFLVNRITHWDSSKKNYIADTKLLGVRAYAISLNDGEAFADPDTYFQNMIADMVRTKVQTMSEEELESFYNISRQYYYEDKTAFGLSATYCTDAEMWNYGFFTDVYGHSFPDSAYDLRVWLTAVITYSHEQFEAKYGVSTMMMNKYDALLKIVEDLGYVLR